MAKTKISEFSSTPANNTDIDSINIAEGCAPSNINDAIRELMAQLKDFQTGAVGDSFNGPIGSSTASTGAFTNITASGTLGVTGVATLGAGAILNTPASVTLTNATGLPISTGVSGLGTGVATALAVNVGSAGAPVVNGGALGTPSSGTVTNLTGTASININGTVGATTPTTGAFTTVAASGAVTLSGGTANGVTYLNGSKVLTSGSALTYNGSTFKVAGTDAAIIAGFGGTTKGVRIETTATGTSIGGVDSAFVNSFEPLDINGSYTTYSTSGTERMRLTSTGLGIGTSSPAAPLSFASSTGQKIRFYNSLSGYGIGVESSEFRFVTDNSASFTWGIGTYASPSEQMRLTSTGLGIGTSSPASKFDLEMAASTNGGMTVGVNNSMVGTIGTGGFSVNGGAITNFGIRANANLLFATGSGAPLRMTLDSAGNLGLGVTPSAWSGYTALQVNNAISLWTSAGSSVYLSNNVYTDGVGRKYVFNGYASEYQSGSGAHYWKTAASGTAGNAISFTQAMTLDASGDFQLGTTSSTFGNKMTIVGGGGGDAYLTVGDGTRTGYIGSNGTVVNIGSYSNTPVTFNINDTERARIDSSGNLLVASTSVVGGGRLGVKGAAGGNVAGFQNGDDVGRGIAFLNASGSGTGSITWNATTTTYATSSDYRLKNTIAPMTGALAKVAQLKPVTYKWNADGSDGEGFIAHELAEVCPQAVSGEKDAVDEEGNPKYQGIDTSFLVATLAAAIQELKASMDAVKAEFDAYKASHP